MSGQRWCEAELHRSKGELLSEFPDAPQAESCLQRSLVTARRQHAKLWELRAACSLGRLWRDQGRPDDAGDLLGPIYGWFSEGFDTPDLKEAKALLDGLSGEDGRRAAVIAAAQNAKAPRGASDVLKPEPA